MQHCHGGVAMKVETILARKGREVITVRPGASVQTAAASLAHHRVGAVVVSRDGRRIDGIFTERDLVRGVTREGSGYLARRIEDAVVHKVYTCAREDDIYHVVLAMKRHRIRHMPVRSEGALGGMISVVDILREYLLREGMD